MDGGYGALSAEGLGENSAFAGCSQQEGESSAATTGGNSADSV